MSYEQIKTMKMIGMSEKNILALHKEATANSNGFCDAYDIIDHILREDYAKKGNSDLYCRYYYDDMNMDDLKNAIKFLKKLGIKIRMYKKNQFITIKATSEQIYNLDRMQQVYDDYDD